MKKALFATFAFLLAACGPEPVEPTRGPSGDENDPIAVESVKINPEEATIEMGKTCQLEISVLPENATDKSWSISSSKPGVASVDDSGLVTGNGLGKATITVFAADKMAQCNITVVAQTVYATAVTLSESKRVLMPRDSFKLKYENTPSKLGESPVWSSSDEAVATVGSDGTVIAVSEGTASITISFANVSASCEVQVKPELGLIRVDPLEKIIRDKSYSDNPDTIRVARGETVTVQMDVEASKSISNIKPKVNWFGSPGQMLCEPRIYWERETHCKEMWNDWAGGRPSEQLDSKTGYYPDALMPIDEWDVSLNRGEQNGLWVEFDIPRDFTPGLYSGEIEVSGSGESQKREFYVQVYEATLPEKQGLVVINWECGDFCAMNNDQDIEYHNTWKPLMTALVTFMNDYGQNAWRTVYAAKHNMGGKCHIDNSTNPPTIKYDFGDLWEREFNLYIDCCPNLRQVHGLQIASRTDDRKDLAIGSYYIDENGELQHGYCYATETDDYSMRVKAGLVQYFRALKEFLEAHKLPDGRTWFDLYVQTITDEPNEDEADAYTVIGRLIHEGAPGMKVTDAIVNNKIAPDAIDYPCPTLSAIENNRAMDGQTQWLYTCISPQGDYANRFIRLPLIKTRIVHWCNYDYNAVGYLHWGLKYWQGSEDPWNEAAGQFLGGDMFIVYPGYHRVYPSIRLCAMRDGIRDYDLLRMIESRSKVDADAFCHRLVLGPAQYDTNLADFRQLRREMLEYLSR